MAAIQGVERRFSIGLTQELILSVPELVLLCFGGNMKPRLDYKSTSPGAMKAMLGVEKFVENCGLEPSLLNLVKLRASQLNGCAFCIDMHSKDLRADGESEQRIHELDAWRETPFYSAREQAALAWTEAVTLLSDGHVPDGVFEQAKTQFSEKELVDLTLAIVAINGWNRLNVAFRTAPGGYKAGMLDKTLASVTV